MVEIKPSKQPKPKAKPRKDPIIVPDDPCTLHADPIMPSEPCIQDEQIKQPIQPPNVEPVKSQKPDPGDEPIVVHAHPPINNPVMPLFEQPLQQVQPNLYHPIFPDLAIPVKELPVHVPEQLPLEIDSRPDLVPDPVPVPGLKNWCSTHRRCWIALLLLLLIGAVVGIIIGVTSPSTSSSGQITSPSPAPDPTSPPTSSSTTPSPGQTTSPSPDPDPISPSTSSPSVSPAPQSFCQVGSVMNGEAVGDKFGTSVALSSDGNRVAIGAYSNDGNGVDAGHVRIFEWSGSEWIQVGSDLDGEAAGDYFGRRVALSSDGNRVAIGAMWNNGNGENAGHVHIFEWSGSQWIQVGSDIDAENAGDEFGRSVALSSDGNHVAIGASQYKVDSSSGEVYIYDWSGGSEWNQVGELHGEGAGDEFGYSLALSSDGNRVAIVAYSNDGNGDDAGHVSIFDWSGSKWIHVSDLDGEAANDYFGTSLALSADGNRVAIGAPHNDGVGDDAGRVQIFDWSGSEWNKVGSDLDGEAPSYDYFGTSVALSSDGNRVAIGAPFNGDYAGHVRIFDWSGSEWIQVGSDIDGKAPEDRFGSSVALSSDGNRVAIGAPGDPFNNDVAGYVQIFDLEASCL